MNRDSIDETGKPFEPETPEEFFQRGEEAFQVWWSELDPPGSSGGLELDYETARAVWSAAYEHNAACTMLVYDGAESLAGAAHSTGEMELACVVHRHHNGTITLPNPDFINWVAKHEDHIRRDYKEHDRDADADTITLWIDHAGESPPSSRTIKRRPSHSSENVRSRADEKFFQWWKRLNPPGTLALMNLDRDQTRFVWHEAFAKLWEDLEVVHDSAKAYAEVVSETASLELAYIVDRFHNGKLTFAVNDVLKYWDQNEYILERHRTDEAIFLRILCVKQDGGS
jgi:hypothetical protein